MILKWERRYKEDFQKSLGNTQHSVNSNSQWSENLMGKCKKCKREK